MMTMENAQALEEENVSLKALVVELKEQVDWLKKQLFGAKSERLIDNDQEQLQFPGLEVLKEETEEEVGVKGHTRKRISHEKTKIEYPEDLLKEQIFLDISEDQKVCPLTGEPLKKIGEEISQKVMLPRLIRLLLYSGQFAIFYRIYRPFMFSDVTESIFLPTR